MVGRLTLNQEMMVQIHLSLPKFILKVFDMLLNKGYITTESKTTYLKGSNMTSINTITMSKNINSTVRKTLKKAEQVYGRSFPEIEIRNDIKGKTAGWFCVKAGHKYFRFNPVIWNDNKDVYDSTVVHEVAHYIQSELYPVSKPHGAEWKSVMTRLGANPKRCHSMNVRSTQKRTFVYGCNCMDHDFTIIRHNKVQKKGVKYTCNKCKTSLKFKKEV